MLQIVYLQLSHCNILGKGSLSSPTFIVMRTRTLFAAKRRKANILTVSNEATGDYVQVVSVRLAAALYYSDVAG
jgi:hypothetical protein